ncbi:MAG: hypothetical protein O2984_06650, partial [Bacteroidetes bacterium]|nr:hypothetical protein [Bacteroidota bacterium]
VQAAHDAASPGDTLLVTGSTTSYSTLTLVKPLVVYGESIDGVDFPKTTISTINFRRLNSSLSSSGSRVYGLQVSNFYFDGTFTGYSAGQAILEDFIIERCRVSGGTVYQYDGLSNLTFRNCWFSGGTMTIGFPQNPNISNLIFTNNVIDNFSFAGGYSNMDFNGNIVFRNNLFINRTSNAFNSNMQEIVLENNIFYRAEPTGLVNSTFNNNLSYLCNNNDLPYGSNVGSGNLVNVDPNLANYPALGGAGHSWDWDYSLQAGSPAISTGTNGSDIGINSGNSPVANLYTYAKIPAVTSLDIPVSSVPVGGTLQINIQAVSRD